MPPEPTRRLRSHFLSMYLRGRARETEREEQVFCQITREQEESLARDIARTHHLGISLPTYHVVKTFAT